MHAAPYIWETIGSLVTTACFSVLLGGTAETEFVKKWRQPLSLVALGVWVWSVSCCVKLVPHHYFCLGLLGIVWASVFLLGAMVVTTQEITTVNGTIHIKKDSALYWVLTKWGGLDLDKPRTLCNLSWIGMGAIILAPAVWCVVFLSGAIFFSWMFLLSGRNPWYYYQRCKADSYNIPTLRIVYWKKIPLIPLFPIIAGIIVWCFVSKRVWHSVSDALILVALIATILAALFASIRLGDILSDAIDKRFSKKKAETKEHGQGMTTTFYKSALKPTGKAIATGVLTPITVIGQTIAAIKGRLCPMIVVDGLE